MKHLEPEIECGEPVLPEVNRREFLALAGAGLFVFVMNDDLFAQYGRERGSYPTDFNAYLRLGEDGRVTCMVGKIEMGQGAMTSLAQQLAEELDVAYDRVDMLMGDTDLCPWDGGTWGSLTTRQFGPVLRGAAAEARAVLLEMAAERLHSVEPLSVHDGVVVDPKQGTKVTYAELVAGRRIERHVPKAAAKPDKPGHAAGQSPVRKDAHDKVTGKAVFAGDIQLPGLLQARVLLPPAHGAKLKRVDTTAAEKLPGVRVIHEGDLVAVLHARRDLAGAALATVKADFAPPAPGVDDQNIFDHLLKSAGEARVVHEQGELAAGEKLATQTFDETYRGGYVAHAPIEPHTATAKFEDGKLTVWASTQAPFLLKGQLAHDLELAPEKVRVITPYVGGGFGGKSRGAQAITAAKLARLAGAPVQLIWERAEEFFYDSFRPAALTKIRSGVDARGQIVFWDFRGFGGGEREARQFYSVANERTVYSTGQAAGVHPFATGPWRAPSVPNNTFARESHIDIMAAKAKIDPVSFRRNNLADARMRRVLDAAAKQFGGTFAPAPSGRGIGVALGIDSGAYVATIAEVAVDRSTGHVQVKRVVCAQDQGFIVNPDGSRQQVEGSITMGLGYALTEELRFRSGDILDRNFDTYELPRFSWLPRIEVVLVENPELAAQGCGEPAIITLGAVVASAIFDATGCRLTQMPMTPARLKAALAGGAK
jgi:isoquinoline 1-oxidoreductase